MLLSAIFISIREHICKSISPAKATKTPRTHLIATNWRQLDNFVWSDSVKWHIFTNFQMPKSLQWSGPSPQAHTHKDQINSNQLKRQPQSILKFLWGGRIYIMQISATFGWVWIQLSQHILPCHFICGYILFSKNYPGEPSETREKDEKEVKTLQYGNSVSFSFTFEGSLLASFRLPPTVQHLLLGCPARWFSSVQFSSVQFGSVELAAFCCKQSQRCTGYSRTRSRNRSTVVAEYKRI